MSNSTPEVIRVNGKIDKVLPEDGISFSLEELQTVVGGHIEIVALFDGRMMVLNEEGKLDNLPVNVVATGMFNHPPRAWFDPICGNVLVCYANWLDAPEPDEDEDYVEDSYEKDWDDDDETGELIDRDSTGDDDDDDDERGRYDGLLE